MKLQHVLQPFVLLLCPHRCGTAQLDHVQDSSLSCVVALFEFAIELEMENYKLFLVPCRGRQEGACIKWEALLRTRRHRAAVQHMRGDLQVPSQPDSCQHRLFRAALLGKHHCAEEILVGNERHCV